MEAHVSGVSTRSVDDLVVALGGAQGISKSEVSRICAGLDADLEAFRTRPLDHIAFPYLFADATYVKARVAGRVVSRAVVIIDTQFDEIIEMLTPKFEPVAAMLVNAKEDLLAFRQISPKPTGVASGRPIRSND
jgi:hypothetical protein